MPIRILVLASLFALSSCTSVLDTIASGSEVKCLVLDGNDPRERNGVVIVAGSVRNDCARAYETVTVTFKMAMADKPPGMLYGYVRNIKPGEVKNFKTPPMGGNPTVTFDKITAY